MCNDNIVLVGLLFLLYGNGSVNMTQLLLLLALLSTTTGFFTRTNTSSN